MKLDSMLVRIRGMKDRMALHQIIHAAEARDSKLSNIEADKERARLWEKYKHIKPGDTVYVHTNPKREMVNVVMVNGKKVKQPKITFMSSMHQSLWAETLTIRAVKPRSKEFIIRESGRDWVLTVGTCDKLKLSLEPSKEALAAALGGKQELLKKSGDNDFIPPARLTQAQIDKVLGHTTKGKKK